MIGRKEAQGKGKEKEEVWDGRKGWQTGTWRHLKQKVQSITLGSNQVKEFKSQSQGKLKSWEYKLDINDDRPELSCSLEGEGSGKGGGIGLRWKKGMTNRNLTPPKAKSSEYYFGQQSS